MWPSGKAPGFGPGIRGFESLHPSHKIICNMKKLSILLSTVLVAILVAIVYYYFEAAVHHSISFVWDDVFNTENNRLLVVPLCLVIGLTFFGLQHYLDPKSETHESEGLGEAPDPTLKNLFNVLLIGFFSLLAGASLGPEAILVPACLLVGAYVGVKFYQQDKVAPKLLSMVGLVALFAAFFNSFIFGMLGLLLVTKQVKVKINVQMIIIAALASATTVLVLKLLSSDSYLNLPPHEWKFSFASLLAIILLFVAGYGFTYSLKLSHNVFEKLHKSTLKQSWIIRGLLATVGLSILYLLGGVMVEFTGNESIEPMLEQAASLGLLGLVWILIIKTLAISWSKTLGYRGGLVFPSVFAASVMVAIAQLYADNLSFTIGLIAVMSGVIIADFKTKILF